LLATVAVYSFFQILCCRWLCMGLKPGHVPCCPSQGRGPAIPGPPPCELPWHERSLPLPAATPRKRKGASEIRLTDRREFRLRLGGRAGPRSQPGWPEPGPGQGPARPRGRGRGRGPSQPDPRYWPAHPPVLRAQAQYQETTAGSGVALATAGLRPAQDGPGALTLLGKATRKPTGNHGGQQGDPG